MSKLDELIQELCPDGVKSRTLEDCCIILDSKRKPITKAKRVAGEFPYYGANGVQDYVNDYLFEGKFVLVGEDGSVLTTSGKPVVNWAEGKIWVNNHAHIISEKPGVNLRYLFYYLQTVNIADLVHGNIPKLTGKDFKAIKTPIPPMEVQEEIVRLLDEFTAKTAELQAELNKEYEARKKQYEYYRDAILNGDKNAETVKLGDVCDFVRGPFGGALKKDSFVSSGYAVYEQQHAIYQNTNIRYFIDSEKYNDLIRFKVSPNDIIVSCSGTIGKTYIIPNDAPKGIINQALLKLTAHDCLNVRYLQYIFENNLVKIMNNNARGGAIKNVPSVKELKNIEIQLPSNDTQDRIINILDNLESTCDNLQTNISVEFESRQKQYEYYRDKLLTFKELNESEVN